MLSGTLISASIILYEVYVASRVVVDRCPVIGVEISEYLVVRISCEIYAFVCSTVKVLLVDLKHLLSGQPTLRL